MLQRKGGIPRSHSNASYFHGSLLPLTNQDRKTAPASSRTQRRGISGVGSESSFGSSTGYIGSISVTTVIRVTGMLAVAFVTIGVFRAVAGGYGITEELEMDVAEAAGQAAVIGGGLRNNYWQTMDEQKLPLAEYPSIQYALDHSDIVLLYFAASWCPMSAPITKLLDEKFGDILLPPEGSDESKRSINNKIRRAHV